MSKTIRHTSLFLNSDTANTNVIYRSTDRSVFTVNFSPAFSLPTKASNITMQVTRASVWNTFTNISAARANNTIYYTNDLGLPLKYPIVLDDGLYDINALNESIDVQVIRNGHTSGLITLEPDYATSKIVVHISTTGYQLNLAAGVAPYVLLGGTLGQKVPAAALTTAAYAERLGGVASFSVFDALVIHAPNMTSTSSFNGSGSDVIAQFQLDNTPVGSVYQYQPSNPERINADMLSAGSQHSQMTFRLTDQAGVAVNTNGENWLFNLMITYEVPDN